MKRLPAQDRKKLAAEIGVSHEYLYMIGMGQRTPSRKVAAMLEGMTSRKVKASDFDKEARMVVA